MRLRGWRCSLVCVAAGARFATTGGATTSTTSTS
jgi:hypothetical protein